MQRESSRKIIRKFNVYRYNGNDFTDDKIPIIKEKEYKIFINGQKITTVVLTPSNEVEFIYGFLYTSSLIDSWEEVINCRVCDNYNFHVYLESKKERNLSDFNISADYLNRNCSGKYYNPELINSNFSIDPLEIIRIYEKIYNESNIYRLTIGAHSNIFYRNAREYDIFEDINRYNALDKLIGHKVINTLQSDGIVFMTGKITRDVIFKCIKAKFPVIATISAVSTMAIELASRYNISLVGYVTKDSFVILEDRAKRIVNGF
jgi:FdhD protein